MATTVTMPKQGFDMEEGVISAWVKQVGDAVKKGDVIAEIETDKATVELPAEAEGTLIEILVPAGQTVPVGTVLARIGEAGEQPAGDGQAAPVPAPSAQEKDEGAARAETAAPIPEPPMEPDAGEEGRFRASPVARRLAETQGVDLSQVRGSGPGGRITKEDVESHLRSPNAREPQPPSGVRASPAARRLAQERGIDIAQVKGTGPEGRVVVADVEAFQPAAAPQPAAPQPVAAPAAAAPAPAAAPASAPAVQPLGAAEDVALTRMRQRIAQVMTSSKGPVPHFYVTMSVDMDAAMAERERINATLAEEGLKVSVNDLIVKAAALALRKFPNVNASFAGDKIVRHGDVHVAVAVALEAGLISIVVRHADQKTLTQISQETRAKAGRAREGKLQPDDIGGATFTVSNLGMYGADNFIAVITPPEAAILAVGAVQKQPVVRGDQIVPGQVMQVTISADHRVTDGAEAAQYLAEVKRLLEKPLRLMV